MFRRRSSEEPSGLSLRGAPSSSFSSNGANNNYGVVPPPTVLIQRLIILHDGLMPLHPSKSKRQNKQRRNPTAMLSEDASLEEHGEFILYYYDHSLHFSQEGTRRLCYKKARRRSSNGSDRGEKPPPADHATEEAVRFAGICRALRSLPLALQSETHHNEENAGGLYKEVDETDVVHLKESTLVFIPLELGGDIIAIAQIPRAETPSQTELSISEQSQRHRFGADPCAVKEAIRRIHATFSLFLGGGIHNRLLRTKHLESSKDWVLEVVDDNDEEDNNSSSTLSVSDQSSSRNLKLKDSSVWEVTNDLQAERVEKEQNECSSSNGSRRKPRLTKPLSQSFNSDDGKQTKKSKPQAIGDYRYGGMEELFNLRREQRKLSDQLKEETAPRFGGLQRNNRWGSSSNAEDLFNDIANDFGHNDCERRIENLLGILPITQLRDDLINFYDENLSQMQRMCEIMSGGVGRCVVEMVPTPICQWAGSSAKDPVRGQHPPLAPSGFVCLAASEFMKTLMQADTPGLGSREQPQARLLGMSLFYEDRLVLSEINPSILEKSNGYCHMPPEISYLIAEHFRSSQKAQHQNTTEDHSALNKSNQNADHTPLARWMSSLSIGAAASADAEDEQPTLRGESSIDASPGYVAAPSAPAKYFEDPFDSSLYILTLRKRVWLPRVHLPPSLGLNTEGNERYTETHVAMFESSELSFLLFLDILTSSKNEEGALSKMAEELQPNTDEWKRGSDKVVSTEAKCFTTWLLYLANQLTEFCDTYSSMDTMSEGLAPIKEINRPIKEIDSNKIFPGEPGMDIIYVDRDESSFVLLSQHDLSSNEYKRNQQKSESAESAQNGTMSKFGLFGIGQKPKESVAAVKTTTSRPSKYSNMLDCRHKLAAYLPLDVMLALDDMFNEIGRLTREKNDVLNLSVDDLGANVDNNVDPTKSIELCTFLPQGWVYSRAFGSVELYILLDTSKFVTINDVQKAVTRVRERLFNDKIR